MIRVVIESDPYQGYDRRIVPNRARTRVYLNLKRSKPTIALIEAGRYAEAARLMREQQNERMKARLA